MENIHKRELKMVELFKKLLDNDANFVRPLSDFWKGCEPKDAMTYGLTMAYGLYGLCSSGEGGTMIDGEYAAYYYDKDLSKGHAKIQDFIKKHDLELIWHDCGTPMLVINK